MRPNFAQDPPPTVITVGGFPYKIVDVDFRAWIGITRRMHDFIPNPNTPEQQQHNIELMCEIQTAVFGGVLEDEDPGEVFEGIAEFSEGYPSAPVAPDPYQNERTYSLEYDLNYIILAIRNQSGIDLSYRRTEPFHWWEFLLEFSSLCGEHYILRLMEIRGYKKDQEKPEHQKARFALPRDFTAAEQASLDDINDEFFNA